MQRRAKCTRNAFALVLLIALAFACGFAPQAAFGETTAIDAEPDALQTTIEQTSAAYDDACAKVIELDQQMAANAAKIAAIEQQLPEQQNRSDDALRVLYKLQQKSSSLLDLILGAENLTDFLTKVDYLNRIQQRNLNEVERLSTLQSDLQATKTALDDAKRAADDEKARAGKALKEAQEARERAQREAQAKAEAEAAAQQAREAEAAAAAQRAQEEAAATPEEPTEQPLGGESGGSGTVPAPSPDNADWSQDKATFVAEWAPRIDAYLAGSPLGGQGATFAVAAWDYGVDPRWSPAISNTESTKGRYCAYAHNAWGWGNVNWDSWEEAIDAHVRGLARGYGYTISVAAAQKYCPPNWEHWYNTTLTQMNQI